jgi:hypothetical protein
MKEKRTTCFRVFIIENERFGLVFAKTGSINLGTVHPENQLFMSGKGLSSLTQRIFHFTARIIFKNFIKLSRGVMLLIYFFNDMKKDISLPVTQSICLKIPGKKVSSFLIHCDTKQLVCNAITIALPFQKKLFLRTVCCQGK